MSSTEQTNRYWLVAIVVVAAVSLGYSVVIMQRILMGLGPVVLILVLYVAWRALESE